MKAVFWTLLCGIMLASCAEEEPEKKKEVPGPEVLVEIHGTDYVEYYPGRKQIKFEGTVDDSKARNGVWHHYNESGLEISTTEYKHGKKHGLSIVKYSNGQLYYTGEYRDDKRAGVWRTYGRDGTMKKEVNYDEQ